MTRLTCYMNLKLFTSLICRNEIIKHEKGYCYSLWDADSLIKTSREGRNHCRGCLYEIQNQ